MKLRFLKQKALNMLEKDIAENLTKYQAKEDWIDDYFKEKNYPNYYFESDIEYDEFELTNTGSESDFENAKIVYEALTGKINLVQASDLRLWAFFAHASQWNYMCHRWGIDQIDPDEEDEQSGKKSPVEKAIDRVGFRYFFKASKGKAFVRHGIARLYWSAYLTYDENNSNPYEYTEFFFSKQDIFTSVTERSFARNKVLVLAALKELKKHPELSREEIRLFLAKLNQSGAITVLDFLDEVSATNLCEEIMAEVSTRKVLEEGSTFSAINNITGKKYGPILKILNGNVTALGKSLATKPKKLIGKKEGSHFTIAGKQYIVKDIK